MPAGPGKPGPAGTLAFTLCLARYQKTTHHRALMSSPMPKPAAKWTGNVEEQTNGGAEIPDHLPETGHSDFSVFLSVVTFRPQGVQAPLLRGDLPVLRLFETIR